MAPSLKYRTASDAPRGHSSGSSTDREALDHIGMAEAAQAPSAVVTALIDILNALVLRIALARNTHDGAEDSNPSYYN